MPEYIYNPDISHPEIKHDYGVLKVEFLNQNEQIVTYNEKSWYKKRDNINSPWVVIGEWCNGSIPVSKTVD